MFQTGIVKLAAFGLLVISNSCFAVMLSDWHQLIHQYQAKSELEQIERVNRFFNQIPYASDFSLWQAADYWASPAELIVKNAGDCEDYALAKYVTLRKMGVASDKLHLTYHLNTKTKGSHMVLQYRVSRQSSPLVLDNKHDSLSVNPDLEPIYSFNEHGLWLAEKQQLGKKLGPATRLSHWQDFRKRTLF